MRTRTNNHRCRVVSIARLLLTLSLAASTAACGGDPDPSAGEESDLGQGGKQGTVKDLSGYAPKPTGAGLITWRYRANEGKPVRVVSEGVETELAFDPIEVTLDATGVERTLARAKLASGSGSNRITGSVTSRGEIQLTPLEKSSGIERERLAMEMDMTGGGITLRFETDLTMTPASPLPRPLDHVDLDTLPLGQLLAQKDLRAPTSGTTKITIDGTTESDELEDTTIISHSWHVDARMPSLVVLGRTYKDVIELSHSMDTVLEDQGTESTGRETVWIARGVGVVKARRPAANGEEPVLWELTSGDLVP